MFRRNSKFVRLNFTAKLVENEWPFQQANCQFSTILSITLKDFIVFYPVHMDWTGDGVNFEGVERRIRARWTPLPAFGSFRRMMDGGS